MNWLKHIILNNWFISVYKKIKKEISYRKKLREIKKRDPYIYK